MFDVGKEEPTPLPLELKHNTGDIVTDHIYLFMQPSTVDPV